MKMYLITSLLILIGGALSHELNCQKEFGHCTVTSLTQKGISREDINEIIQAERSDLTPNIIQKFGKNKICALLQSMEECVPAAATGECTNDAKLQQIIAELPMIKSVSFIMGCAQSGRDVAVTVNVNCVNQLRNCSYEGMAASGVTQNEIDSVLQSVDNRMEKIDKIGKERGCEFVQVFNECHDQIKNQCGDDEPNFKPVLKITKTTHDHLKCGVTTKMTHDHLKSGCASTVASLVHIWASIFLVSIKNHRNNNYY